MISTSYTAATSASTSTTVPAWQQPPAGYSLDCLVGGVCAPRQPAGGTPFTCGGAIDAILAYDEAALAIVVCTVAHEDSCSEARSYYIGQTVRFGAFCAPARDFSQG